jgi:geranylgeranyl diphosphate synthase, type I
MSTKDLSDNDIRRWKTLIAATGAVDWIERSIDLRIRQASRWVDTGHLDAVVRTALADMAAACTDRAA